MQEITKIRLEVTEHFGADVWKKFRNSYRFAKERCCNPNNKDYKYYEGKWGFVNVVEYFNTCFNLFLKALEVYDINDLSIDRIDSKGKYEPDNIRFVPMKLNLRNKEVVNTVRCTNLLTGEEVLFPSFFSISKEKLDTRFSTTGVWGAFHKKHLYKGCWVIDICN